MTKLLSKEQLERIRCDYERWGDARATKHIPDLLDHARALEARWASDVAGYSNQLLESQVACERLSLESIATLGKLQRLGAERDEWKKMHDKLAEQWSSWSSYAERKIEAFRLRAIEAIWKDVEVYGPIDLGRTIETLQSLPATEASK